MIVIPHGERRILELKKKKIFLVLLYSTSDRWGTFFNIFSFGHQMGLRAKNYTNLSSSLLLGINGLKWENIIACSFCMKNMSHFVGMQICFTQWYDKHYAKFSGKLYSVPFYYKISFSENKSISWSLFPSYDLCLRHRNFHVIMLVYFIE